MTHIEHAIKEAVEKGGYRPTFMPWPGDNCENKGEYFAEISGDENRQYRIFLDPLFWQALGKAKGWGSEWVGNPVLSSSYVQCVWLKHWHRFIDHLAEGKDTESFFATLV